MGRERPQKRGRATTVRWCNKVLSGCVVWGIHHAEMVRPKPGRATRSAAAAWAGIGAACSGAKQLLQAFHDLLNFGR